MAPARDGAGDDAAPVAPAERAGGSCSGGVSALVSVPWALVVVFFVLTAVFYEDAMELRMHARRPMFGGLGLTPESVHPARDPADAAAGLGVGRGRRHRVSREEIGPADAATGWRDPPAADGVEAAPATTLGYGGYGESLPETSPGRGPCCASVNLGCDETAYVTQVDLDRDPRLRSARCARRRRAREVGRLADDERSDVRGGGVRRRGAGGGDEGPQDAHRRDGREGGGRGLRR